ncbi:MAG TPA: hypothetical protein VLH79_00360 [Chthonomonadales bacterium]|nr:hypothetical protein [Chthonomonadales bacterium]
MRLYRPALCLIAVALSSTALAQERTNVPRVAILWTFAENERGTSPEGMRTANDLIRKLFEERAGFEIVPNAVARTAWRELGYPDRPGTVEDPGQLPIVPDARQLLEFGRRAGVDFVCVGTLAWRVRSMWVGLGPKTRATATVNVTIVDVRRAEVALEVRDLSSDSTRAERWYESAGALLVTWGITVFSGGPKTPHIQRAAVKAIGAATDPYFTQTGRRIGGARRVTPDRHGHVPEPAVLSQQAG